MQWRATGYSEALHSMVGYISYTYRNRDRQKQGHRKKIKKTDREGEREETKTMS